MPLLQHSPGFGLWAGAWMQAWAEAWAGDWARALAGDWAVAAWTGASSTCVKSIRVGGRSCRQTRGETCDLIENKSTA